MAFNVDNVVSSTNIVCFRPGNINVIHIRCYVRAATTRETMVYKITRDAAIRHDTSKPIRRVYDDIQSMVEKDDFMCNYSGCRNSRPMGGNMVRGQLPDASGQYLGCCHPYLPRLICEGLTYGAINRHCRTPQDTFRIAESQLYALHKLFSMCL